MTAMGVAHAVMGALNLARTLGGVGHRLSDTTGDIGEVVKGLEARVVRRHTADVEQERLNTCLHEVHNARSHFPNLVIL